MHHELARSLDYLACECRDRLDFDHDAALRLVARIDLGARLPPVAFARYYALALSLLAGDKGAAVDHWRDLLAVREAAPGLLVSALEAPSTSALGALYARMMQSDGDIVVIRPPSPEVAVAFKQRFDAGLDLIERAFPELAAEFRGIIREVVCVVGDPTRPIQFDGGSHFQLWGALFINAEFHPTAEAMMEVLAHESAHSLLFGFCIVEPLTYGDDEQRYQSPLRADPRPMEGIYHATFVSARMHLAMSRLCASGLVEPTVLPAIVAAMQADEQNFRAGDEVVRAHAELSKLGRELIENARAYMARVSGS